MELKEMKNIWDDMSHKIDQQKILKEQTLKNPILINSINKTKELIYG